MTKPLLKVLLFLTGWKTVDTIPKDGTVVNIVESPNGESYNFMQARYTTLYHNPNQPDENPSWWGVGWRLGFNSWDGNYGALEAVACTPILWKPTKNRLERLVLKIAKNIYHTT